MHRIIKTKLALLESMQSVPYEGGKHTISRTNSLRSKRFRLVLEQRNTEEGDFRFWPREKWNEFYLRHFSRGLWLSFLVLFS